MYPVPAKLLFDTRACPPRSHESTTAIPLRSADVERWPEPGIARTTRWTTNHLMNENHLGSSLDDFLTEEGRLAEAEAVAAKRILAFQIAKLMEGQPLSKAEMARCISTSRAAVDRLV